MGLKIAGGFIRADDISNLFVGNGADSTFGGMDKLLSKDWEFKEFIDRYSFINPKNVVKNPIDITHIFDKFKIDKGINVVQFLKKFMELE